jgi:threonine synthase
VSDGVVKEDESVVAILTGNVLKDTDYVMQYHGRTLIGPDGEKLASAFANSPLRVAASRDAIAAALEAIA